jgi:hypothetical protein
VDPKPASPVVHPGTIGFDDHFFLSFSPQRHRGHRDKFKNLYPDEIEKQDSYY